MEKPLAILRIQLSDQSVKDKQLGWRDNRSVEFENNEFGTTALSRLFHVAGVAKTSENYIDLTL